MMYLLLAKEMKPLRALSTIVLISVIMLIVATFIILFYVYYKYYVKCINNHLEDETIKAKLFIENKKYFDRLELTANNELLTKEKKLEVIEPLSNLVEKKDKKKSSKPRKILSLILTSGGYIFLFCMIISALIVNIKGNLFYIGGKAKLVVLTSSMQSVEKSNSYIKANNLTNQIPANALITLEKVKSEADIKLYDIIAYEDDHGDIIVHRVIHIFEEDGVTKFTCRGDANNASTSYEEKLTMDKIIGKYTGKKNYILGIFITYLGSSIGVITIVFAFLTITLYESFDNRINKAINKRKKVLATEIDESIRYKLKNGEEIHFHLEKKVGSDSQVKPKDEKTSHLDLPPKEDIKLEEKTEAKKRKKRSQEELAEEKINNIEIKEKTITNTNQVDKKSIRTTDSKTNVAKSKVETSTKKTAEAKAKAKNTELKKTEPAKKTNSTKTSSKKVATKSTQANDERTKTSASSTKKSVAKKKS